MERTATERLFPTLTAAQMTRIAARGRRRQITAGQILIEAADKNVPFFLVVSGQLQAVRPSAAAETLIVALRPGQFSGEANLITGRRTI